MWAVFINSKDSGIIESNYAWAEKYWRKRAQKTGLRITLRLHKVKKP